MSDEDARLLMSQAVIGRIGVTMGGLPVILPVTFRMLDGDVMFFAGEGAKLRAATMDAVVAFEVDHLDGDAQGWSVTVIGLASEVSDAATIAAARRAGLASWAGAGDHLIRVTTTHLRGFRL